MSRLLPPVQIFKVISGVSILPKGGMEGKNEGREEGRKGGSPKNGECLPVERSIKQGVGG